MSDLTRTPFFDEPASKRHLELFLDRVREQLSAKVREAVDAEIAKAIEDAMADLSVQITREFDSSRVAAVVHVILTDKRSK